MESIRDKVDAYMDKPYNIVITMSDGFGVGGCVAEFPGCITCGNAPDEVLREIYFVMRDWLTASIEAGHQIPEPVCPSEIVRWCKTAERAKDRDVANA